MTNPIDKAQLRALAEAADDRPYNADATTAFRAAVPAHKVLAMLDEWERTERNRDMWKEQCASQAAQLEALRADAARLDWLREECCDLRSISVPTGGDDADVDWVVISHHMAGPRAREIGRGFSWDPRAAIDAAMKEKTP